MSTGNVYFDYIRINSFQVRTAGTYTVTDEDEVWFDIQVEVDYNLVGWSGGGGSRGQHQDWFEWDITLQSPIDVESVTAIIIHDYRIEIPQ